MNTQYLFLYTVGRTSQGKLVSTMETAVKHVMVGQGQKAKADLCLFGCQALGQSAIGLARVGWQYPMLLLRECTEQCVKNECDTPAKTRVIYNDWVINMDPRYWTQEKKFISAFICSFLYYRWILDESNRHILSKGGYLPFGLRYLLNSFSWFQIQWRQIFVW